MQKTLSLSSARFPARSRITLDAAHLHWIAASDVVASVTELRRGVELPARVFIIFGFLVLVQHGQATLSVS